MVPCAWYIPHSPNQPPWERVTRVPLVEQRMSWLGVGETVAVGREVKPCFKVLGPGGWCRLGTPLGQSVLFILFLGTQRAVAELCS